MSEVWWNMSARVRTGAQTVYYKKNTYLIKCSCLDNAHLAYFAVKVYKNCIGTKFV